MATPSWIKRLNETGSENGGSAFGIPSASLYTAGSSIGSRSSSSRYLAQSNENVSDPRRCLSQDNSNISDKNRSKTLGCQNNVKAQCTPSNASFIPDNEPSTLRSNPYSGDDLESQASSRYLSSRRTRNNPRPQKNNTPETRKYNSSKNGTDSTRKEPNRGDSWSYVDSEGYARLPPSIHTSVSYGEFEGSSVSGNSFPPRNRNTHSAPPSTLDQNDKKKRRRKRDSSSDEIRTSSGYNSYSELSEFATNSRSSENRYSKSLPSSADSQTDIEKGERYSKFPRKSSRAVEEKTARVSAHKRSDSKLSVTESDFSGSSKDKTKRKHDRGSAASLDSKMYDSKTTKIPTIGNVAVTVTNNIQYDPNDPFAFVQQIDLPFHVKVRKCLGPVMAIILLLILAAALGAAIYFASALKETQENKIDLLRANLAMKIRNIDHIENIEDLSTHDFKNLSLDYCKHMDMFYTKSKFRETYRGCEVIAIKNSYINFTLFFDEKDATSSQIMEVIKSSAQTVRDKSTQVAVVDKFELELNTLEVKMDRKIEPETFNKKTANVHLTRAKPRVTPPTKRETTVRSTASTRSTSTSKPTTIPRTTAGPQHSPGKKKPPPDKPVYSWDPCTEFEGMYFPHPTECDLFIQCTNGQTIEQRCTTGLLYHWKQLTCVSRFMPNVLCPDPSKAPPRPTTTLPTTAVPTTTPMKTTLRPTTPKAKVVITTLRQPTTKQFVPEGVVLTAIAGRFAERPKYAANPCQNKVDVKLYPHPDDCAMFIQCVNGKVQNMNCAKGLVFDPSISACIFPTDNDLLCPDIKPCQVKDDGYFPHPYDCSKFIQCQFKKELVLACQNGLVWSEKVNSCVHKTGSSVCPLDPKR